MGGGGKEGEERYFEEALELGGVEVLALLALARHEGTRAVGAFERVVAILHPGFDGLRIHMAPALIAVQLLGQLLAVKMGALSIRAPRRFQHSDRMQGGGAARQ